jgi:ATP-dependent Clp protease ATP-binding subunit ClpA
MASRAINSFAVSVINAATTTMGDNRRVELSQTVIFLTSNLGGGEITELRKFEAEWHG